MRFVLAGLLLFLTSVTLDAIGFCRLPWCENAHHGGGGGGGGGGGACGGGGTVITLSPVCNVALSGQSVSFSASTASNVASVEFRMGGYWLGTVTTPPFNITWNSGWAYDGNTHVQAIARDGFGNILGTADNPYTINNYGNTFTLTSPNFDTAQSGTMTITASVSDVLAVADQWSVQIDGVLYHSKIISPIPNPFSFNVDTTTLFNGSHEIYITGVSQNEGGSNTLQATVQHHRLFTTSNGHTLLGVAPNLIESYIGTSGTVNVGCQRIFTDNTTGACTTPAYTSSDTTVATVNATSGLVTAVAEGFVTIAVSDASGKSGNAYVWVRTATGIPHFAGNGTGILTSYNASTSLWVNSPFYTQPNIVKNDMGNSFGASAPTELKRAGVNTLQDQSYDGGPTYGGPPCDSLNYTTWQTNFDNGPTPSGWSWAASNGFHLMGLGDGYTANVGQEGWCNFNWPSANLAFAHAIQTLFNSGVAVSQEMSDEQSAGWGSMTNPGTGLVGQTGPYLFGSTDYFQQVVCNGTTCTITWPNHQFVNNETNPGINFALAGSSHSQLNTVFTFGQLASFFVATNSTTNTFDFTPLSAITGTFNSSTDPGLTFLQFGRYPCEQPHPAYTSNCSPVVPNNVLSQFSTWMHQATNPLPVAWIAVGRDPVQVHANWAGKTSLSDYAEHYWVSGRARQAYAWAQGVAEQNFELRKQFIAKQPYMKMDAPQLQETVDNGGPLYTKQSTSGGYYIPLTDTLSAGGIPLSSPFSQIMTAAANGQAGVRTYLFENSSTVAAKYTAANGTGMQTGGSPYTADPQSTYAWHQIGYAYNVLNYALTPYILNKPLSSPYFGPVLVDGPSNSLHLNDVGNSWSTVAARQGSDADLLLIVNGTDSPQTYTANLAPYVVGGTPATARYVISADYVQTTLLTGGAMSDTVTLPEGGAVAYLIPTVATWTNLPTQAVALTPPNVGQTSTSVVYSYVFQGDLAKQTFAPNCTGGCTLNLDRRIGDVFYQYIYMNASGVVTGRSSVTDLPQLTHN